MIMTKNIHNKNKNQIILWCEGAHIIIIHDYVIEAFQVLQKKVK